MSVVTAEPRTYHTPQHVADLLGFAKVDSVYSLISSGALRAVNIATGTGRPSWRISDDALNAFLDSRTTGPARSEPPRKRRPSTATRYF